MQAAVTSWRVSSFVSALLAAAAVSFACPDAGAQAEHEDVAAADAELARAGAAERELELGAAAEAYARAERLAPKGPHADAAHARAAYLAARSEGGFAPLIALERVRREPRTAADPAALRELGAASRAFPEGRVRGEAWLFLAAALQRGHEEDSARAYAELALRDPASDAVLRGEAASLLIELCERRRQTSCLDDVARTPGLPDAVRARARRLARRPRLMAASGAVLALVLGGSVALLLRARRAGSARLRIPWRHLALSALFAGTIGLGGLLAASYEDASPAPFLLLATAVFALSALGATLARASTTTPRVRLVRAAGFALAVVAASLLCLYASGPDYLGDFGL